MSAPTTKAASGMFGPVTGPDGGHLDARSMEYKEGKREKKLVDTDELPNEYKEAVEAEHFVIYGKASVEQYDEDDQRVDIDALEGSLDQLFNSGNISRRHKDVRVGEPRPDWELEEDKVLEIDGERFEFQSGDTLTTGANPSIVQDRRDGEPDDDEFWIVADIWADTEIGKDTRLRCLSGDLNGFSVTIYAKETETTTKGEDVTDLDWHAVTIGSDEAIKNKESRFALADFKALFEGLGGALGGSDDGAAGGRVTRSNRPSVGGKLMFDNLLKKSADETGFNGELLKAASQATEKAQTDDVDLKQAAEEVSSEAEFKADDVMNTISVLQADTKAASGDDLEEILVGVEGGDLSAEEAMEMIGDADEGGGGEEPPEEPDKMPDDKGDTPDDDEEPGGEEPKDVDLDEKLEERLDEKLDERIDEKLDEKLEDTVSTDQLDEKLDSQRDEIVGTVGEKLDDSMPSADEIAEKMEVGETESPAGGSGSNDRDYKEEMKATFEGEN